MKIFLKTLYYLCISMTCIAQKPPIDISLNKLFPEIVSPVISNDGNHIAYVLQKPNGVSTLVIHSRNKFYSKEMEEYKISKSDFQFTEDSNFSLFINSGDSLCIIQLDSLHTISYIPNCRSFKSVKDSTGQWLAYQLENKDLIVTNLQTHNRTKYINVDEYQFSPGNATLIMKIKIKNSPTIDLYWVDLIKNKETKIWSGLNATEFLFDQSGSQVVFMSKDTTSKGIGDTIWHYQNGKNASICLISSDEPKVPKGFIIRPRSLRFSNDGSKLFFSIFENKKASPHTNRKSNVDIWSYDDPYLEEQRLIDKRYSTRTLMAVINIKIHKLIILQHESDALSNRLNLNTGGDDNYLLVSSKVNSWEGYRLADQRPDIFLVNTTDGTRKCIKKRALDAQFRFSAGGKYVYWYDMENKNYYTYNIKTGYIKNISSNVKSALFNELWDGASQPLPYGVAVWLENDDALLVYDRYDIWKLDPDGRIPPINITNGYGRNNQIILRLISLSGQTVTSPLKSDTDIYLCAFDEKSKENGFFRKKIDSIGNPLKLTMSPLVYYFPDNFSFVQFSNFIIKAKNSRTYLLKQMSATEYPNLVTTKDFINFEKISNLEPQFRYNWLTSEIVSWTTFDGHLGTGILYKPQNFDPSKKYPIIFYIYERFSDGLYNFIVPELCDGPLNIPIFVSRDYLVFCPDIHYTIGEPGKSAYNYVISAAIEMRKRKWVDSTKMGLQGHSFGGFEVNYLITQTDIFSAAASAAGNSNLVSASGSLKLSGQDGHPFFERSQPRLGVTLWQSPNTYVKNSPVFMADRVTTPLLIMHNKKDNTVPWSQSLEFFTSLRRLDKKVWLLQYDNGDHTLLEDLDKLDYTTRLFQFFDHYLKNAPVPDWMVLEKRKTQIN